MNTSWKVVLMSLLLTASVVQAAAMSQKALLLRSYLRVILVKQVPTQVHQLVGESGGPETAEVQAALDAWSQARMQNVGQDLRAQFGEQARDQIEEFVAAYTTAEAQNDLRFLRELVQGLGLEVSECASYPALRKACSAAWLQPDIQEASRWLSNLQTWLKLRSSIPNIPSLEIWQARDQTAVKSTVATMVEPRPTREPSLADAEAEPAAFKGDVENETTPRTMFAAARKKKQELRMAEAQAAMQQVAAERQSAEQDLAARKQAEAQAEAVAVQNQAQKLAATEKQALEQQQNSWGNKLKAIVGTTISAAGGAFFGGVGAQAGQMAANALFKQLP